MSDQERAEKIIEAVCQRLGHLAAKRPFRFIDTRRRDAQNYLDSLIRFQGFTEQEIAQAEQVLSGVFPMVFRTYLARLGKARGELFCGSDLADFEKFSAFKADAETLMRESEAGAGLPPNAVVFLFHQGYSFCYLLAEGGFDAPIMAYREGEPHPKQAATSFEEFIQAELAMMESVNRQSLDRGGHFLTLYPDGFVKWDYPTLNSGIRAIEVGDTFLD